MSESIEIWLSDGEKNRAGLFIDEQFQAPRPNCIAVTVDGEIPIYVDTEPPFAVDARASQLINVSLMLASSIEERLDQITTALECSGTDGDDMDELYEEEQLDLDEDNSTKSRLKYVEQQMRDAAGAFDIGNLSGPAVERLLRDLVALRDNQHAGWKAAPVDRNIGLWAVEFYDFDIGTPLQRDFQKLTEAGGPSTVSLSMKFPREYPFRPPFIRIVRPRFAFRTGRVTVGGSICTQVLTDEGWNPTFDVESLLVTIRAQITDPEANARVDFSNRSDYSEDEAVAAFQRVASHHKQHGW